MGKAATQPQTSGTLDPFDGFPVVGVGIAITNAGDGLSQAMKVDPEVFHHGQEIYVVLKTTVSKVGHVEVTKDEPYEGLRRVHTLRAEEATIVPKDLVETHLEATRIKIQAFKEREAGVQRLPGTAPEIDAAYDDGFDDGEIAEVRSISGEPEVDNG